MILTLNDEQNAIFATELVPKNGDKKEIEYLHYLYSQPDFELGYIQFDRIMWHLEKPKENVLITDYNIQVYDTHSWGKDPINGRYPVEYFKTRAKNTLILIREILGQKNTNGFNLKKFFADSSKEVTSCGILKEEEFNLLKQTKKLKYFLENQELALSILKDAYLDFYLFVDLLTKVDFNIYPINENLFELFQNGAKENTEILTLAKKFAKLKQQQ